MTLKHKLTEKSSYTGLVCLYFRSFVFSNCLKREGFDYTLL